MGKVFVQCQECHQCAQSKPPVKCNGNKRPQKCTQYIADIAKIAVDRHNDVGKLICIVGTVSECFVNCTEFCNALLFMAEYFYHFLPFQHFFNITVYFPDITLLFHKVSTGMHTQFAGYFHHHKHHQKCQYSEGNIQRYHTDKGNHYSNGGVDQLRNTLADQLSQGIYVVGIYRHNIPVGMGIKILNRQGLHMGKDINTQFFQYPLRYINHNAVIHIGAQNAEQIYTGKPNQSCF